MANKRTITISPIEVSLRALFEPLVNALDYETAVTTYDNGVDKDNADTKRRMVSTQQARTQVSDTGHDLPSTRDMGLRIILSQLCQTMHSQTLGVINTKTGSTIPNARERYEESQKQIEQMETRELSGDMLRAMHYFEVNKTRYEAYNELMVALKTIYEEVTREKWQPMTAGSSNARKIDVKELPQAEKDRLVRILGEKKAKAMFAA